MACRVAALPDSAATTTIFAAAPPFDVAAIASSQGVVEIASRPMLVPYGLPQPHGRAMAGADHGRRGRADDELTNAGVPQTPMTKRLVCSASTATLIVRSDSPDSIWLSISYPAAEPRVSFGFRRLMSRKRRCDASCQRCLVFAIRTWPSTLHKRRFVREADLSRDQRFG